VFNFKKFFFSQRKKGGGERGGGALVIKHHRLLNDILVKLSHKLIAIIAVNTKLEGL